MSVPAQNPPMRPGTASVPHGNPFTPHAVVPAARFFGRTHELTAILASLENMLSVSLVGEARIGKSSLLRYLEARLPALLHASGRYLPIYLSMDGQRSQATFCEAVLARLLPQAPSGVGHERTWRALEQRIESAQPITIEETAQALEWTAQAGLRVVLLLDEFKDLLERAEEFDEVFRGVLRSLYTNRQIALIMATRQPLVEIEGLSTYFANGVSQQELALMVSAEAEQLVRQPHDRPFSDCRSASCPRSRSPTPLTPPMCGLLALPMEGSAARSHLRWHRGRCVIQQPRS